MNPTSKEELDRLNALGREQDTLDAFRIDDTPASPAIDRSTLERWADCPYAAACMERGITKVMPQVAEVGSEAHKVFSAGIEFHSDNFHQATAGDVQQVMQDTMLGSRPDLQPEVIVATRSALWPFASFLAKEGGTRDQQFAIRPSNILGYTGGAADKSGQLSTIVGVETITSELDMLWKGPSRDELNVEDFKTGHDVWTATDVAGSFQFQFHAVLVLRNFPDAQTVNVRIWNTRHGGRTGYVQFQRRDLDRWLARINAALAIRYQHAADPLDQIPTWPTVEKCPTCLAASICPAVDRVTFTNPQAMLAAYVASEAKHDALYGALTKHVDAHGEIVGTDGITCFGRNKPRSERKAPAAIYMKGATE